MPIKNTKEESIEVETSACCSIVVVYKPNSHKEEFIGNNIYQWKGGDEKINDEAEKMATFLNNKTSPAFAKKLLEKLQNKGFGKC
jgi:hypothetical protein